MGTSATIGTPTKGNWTNIKNELNAVASNGLSDNSTRNIARETIRGIIAERRKGDGSGVGLGGTPVGFLSKVSRNTAAHGVGFLNSSYNIGFRTALQNIGIDHIDGYSSDELISLLVDAVVEKKTSLDRDIAFDALNELFQNIFGNDPTQYDISLRAYWDNNGIVEFIKGFLKGYCERLVLHKITDAEYERIANNGDTDALNNAITLCVDTQIDAAVDQFTDQRDFQTIDWLGNEGSDLMNDISDNIARLIEEMP